MSRIATALAMLILGMSAHASVTYSYVGNVFTPSFIKNQSPLLLPKIAATDRVTFALALDSALAVGATTQLCHHCSALPAGLSWELSAAGISFGSGNANSTRVDGARRSEGLPKGLRLRGHEGRDGDGLTGEGAAKRTEDGQQGLALLRGLGEGPRLRRLHVFIGARDGLPDRREALVKQVAA